MQVVAKLGGGFKDHEFHWVSWLWIKKESIIICGLAEMESTLKGDPARREVRRTHSSRCRPHEQAWQVKNDQEKTECVK